MHTRGRPITRLAKPINRSNHSIGRTHNWRICKKYIGKQQKTQKPPKKEGKKAVIRDTLCMVQYFVHKMAPDVHVAWGTPRSGRRSACRGTSKLLPRQANALRAPLGKPQTPAAVDTWCTIIKPRCHRRQRQEAIPNEGQKHMYVVQQTEKRGGGGTDNAKRRHQQEEKQTTYSNKTKQSKAHTMKNGK